MSTVLKKRAALVAGTTARVHSPGSGAQGRLVSGNVRGDDPGQLAANVNPAYMDHALRAVVSS